MTGTILYWARAVLRHRRGAALGLMLLTMVATVVPIAAAAGARRTGSSVDRMRAELRPYHLNVQFEEDDAPTDVRKVIGDLPGVELVAEAASLLARPAGADLPAFTSFGQGGIDPTVGRDLERPRLDEGRLPDAADEVLLSRAQSRELGLGVGDELTLETFSPEGVDALFSGEQVDFDGPEVTLRIVGVGRQPEELTAGAESPAPLFVLAPAFFEAWEGRVHWFDGIFLVRLEDGFAGVPDFTRAVRAAFPDRSDIGTYTSEESARIDDALRAQVLALGLLAAIATLTALVAITQGAMRFVRSSDQDGGMLRALGLDRRHRALAQSLTAIVPVAAGAAAAAAVAAAASGLFPTGPAGRVEPDPGFAPDVTVLAGGLVLTVVLLAVAVAALVGRDARREPHQAPSNVSAALARGIGAIAVAVGIHAAFGRDGAGGLSTRRSALIAVALGATGLVGALVFGASLTRLVEQPPRFGWSFDYAVALGDGLDDDEALPLAAETASHPAVESALYARVGSKLIGGESVPIWGVETLSGTRSMTVVRGRTVQSDDEIVLGRSVLNALGLDVGDTVKLTGPDGPRELRIVGQGLVPTGEVDDPAGAGLTTLDTFDDLPEGGGGGYPNLYISAKPGADVRGLLETLESELGSVTPVVPPPVITNLDLVDQSPYLLAGYLAMLGAVAIAHAMITTVRQRRGELATLRTLGFVRRQVIGSVLVHAAAITVVGVAIGMPIGAALGRVSWGAVAAGLGFAADARAPLAVLAMIGPAAVATALLIAAGPAGWVARQRPASILRTE